MKKKDIDWGNLSFAYIKTDQRYVSNYRDGAWDEGVLTEDATVVMSECAGVLQYSQSCFEGLKAYRNEKGEILCVSRVRTASADERIFSPFSPV